MCKLLSRLDTWTALSPDTCYFSQRNTGSLNHRRLWWFKNDLIAIAGEDLRVFFKEPNLKYLKDVNILSLNIYSEIRPAWDVMSLKGSVSSLSRWAPPAGPAQNHTDTRSPSGCSASVRQPWEAQICFPQNIESEYYSWSSYFRSQLNMVQSCSAYGCKNRYQKDKNISFHKWAELCSIESPLKRDVVWFP